MDVDSFVAAWPLQATFIPGFLWGLNAPLSERVLFVARSVPAMRKFALVVSYLRTLIPGSVGMGFQWKRFWQL